MSDKIRLLICHVCKTIEPLGWYEGDPELDIELNLFVDKHKFPDGNLHVGSLADVERKHWDSPNVQRQIITQIQDSAGHTGLDQSFYNTKLTFQEDALSCFAAHNRNPACSDYHSDSKELKPDTSVERQAIGAPKYHSIKRIYLCDYCPVHVLVQQAQKEKLGLYK